MAGRPGIMTSPNMTDVYNTNAKQILVTRDPVYSHPAIGSGYLGRQPPTHLILAIVMTIVNPVLGTVALVFSFMSRRAFSNGDMKFAEKWSQYAFMMCMITVVASIVIYITIGFSINNIGYRGGHSY